MVKKLVRHGNSQALIIDKPILELLGIEEGGPVEIKTDGEWLSFRRSRQGEVDAEFMEQLEELHATHHVTLKKLAE